MAELLEHEKLAQVQNYAQANDIPSRAVPPRSGLNILTPSRTEPALGATGGKAYGLAAAAKPTAARPSAERAAPAERISRAGEAASPRNLSRAASAHALTALENSIDRSPRPRPAAPPPSAPSPSYNRRRRPTGALPSALDIAAALAGGATSARRQLVVFLDYDGTLTPIVKDPAAATLSEPMRDAVKTLAAKSTVAVVSGRAREKIREFVRLEELYYAGSHGFDIDGPGGLRHSVSAEIIPVLAAARDALRRSLAHVAGASVEDNRFAVSVHWRNVAEPERPAVSAVVDAMLREAPFAGALKRSEGKCVYELKPNVRWDKGEAVLYLLELLRRRAMSFEEYGADPADDDGGAPSGGEAPPPPPPPPPPPDHCDSPVGFSPSEWYRGVLPVVSDDTTDEARSARSSPSAPSRCS
ncbi:hypothetical protein JL722_6639 [Aureococcus anophagefferens]|nr:hypothetical protein JL722_6639 [Aureococcus anophagefferens]